MEPENRSLKRTVICILKRAVICIFKRTVICTVSFPQGNNTAWRPLGSCSAWLSGSPCLRMPSLCLIWHVVTGLSRLRPLGKNRQTALGPFKFERLLGCKVFGICLFFLETSQIGQGSIVTSKPCTLREGYCIHPLPLIMSPSPL